jgi:fructooligosaccharide transport system substrate-binding protein
MNRLWTLLLVGLVLGSLILAACQAAPTQAPAPTAAAPQPQPTAASTSTGGGQKAPVTLVFIKIADDLEAKSFNEMLDAFHKIDGGKWSYVNVQYDAKPFAELFPAIEKSVATGADVDLIQADGPDVKHFAYNNVIKDLTDNFTKDELAQWDPGSNAEGTYKGRFYGPAEVQSCQLMWYNQDMVDAAGLKLDPTTPLTYGPNGTALPVFQKLTVTKSGSSTPSVYGFQNVWGFDYFNRIEARTNGKPGSPTFQGVSDDGLKFVGFFDTPESIQAFQFDQDMISKYKVESAQPPTNSLLSGLSASTVYQDLILGTLRDQFPNFKIGAQYPPYWQTPLCQTGSWHYAISSKTKHFDEALAWVKFASSDAGAQFIWKYKNQMPSNVKLLDSLPDYKQLPRSLMADFFKKYGVPRIESPGYTEYNALFSQFYQGLVSGGNVEQLAHDFAKQMETAVAKYAK